MIIATRRLDGQIQDSYESWEKDKIPPDNLVIKTENQIDSLPELDSIKRRQLNPGLE